MEFEVHDVRGDGNCFYTSVITALGRANMLPDICDEQAPRRRKHPSSAAEPTDREGERLAGCLRRVVAGLCRENENARRMIANAYDLARQHLHLVESHTAIHYFIERNQAPHDELDALQYDLMDKLDLMKSEKNVANAISKISTRSSRTNNRQGPRWLYMQDNTAIDGIASIIEDNTLKPWATEIEFTCLKDWLGKLDINLVNLSFAADGSVPTLKLQMRDVQPSLTPWTMFVTNVGNYHYKWCSLRGGAAVVDTSVLQSMLGVPPQGGGGRRRRAVPSSRTALLRLHKDALLRAARSAGVRNVDMSCTKAEMVDKMSRRVVSRRRQ